MSQGDGERRKELVLIPSRSILAKMFYKIAAVSISRHKFPYITCPSTTVARSAHELWPGILVKTMIY